MQRRSRTTPRIRATAIGLTLLAHMAALLFIAIERRTARRESPALLQFVSIWPEAEQAPPLLAEDPLPQEAPAPDTSVPRATRAIRVPVAPEPSTEPASQPILPVTDSTTPAGAVDWNAAVERAAAHIADEAGKPNTFGPPLKGLPEPCVPREFDKETKKLMAERLPEPPDPLPVGPNPHLGSMIVGGRPMAVAKITIPLGSVEARGDLFENMAEKRKVSSVPSPHVCD
jgi:hypothetical protein